MKQQEHKYNIMVYGIEMIGLETPSGEISNHNFKLNFQSFSTNRRFNEFDGVILFQGIFEKYKYGNAWDDSEYLNHSFDSDELDKRKKELILLIKKGGFICFVLHKPFIDNYHSSYTRQNLESTDLCKWALNHESFYRKDSSSRFTQINTHRDEFKNFLDLYGAASSYFENYNNGLNLRIIAKAGDYTVGVILFDNLFFIPSLIPENTGDRISEYFESLAEALTSSFNKLRVEIPSWLNQFAFEKEIILAEKKQQLEKDIVNINFSLSRYTQFKKILLGDGDVLVEHVANVENPEQTSTLFRSMPAPDSGTSQHPIPLEASTRFRNKPAGDSGASQQVFVIYRNDLLS